MDEVYEEIKEAGNYVVDGVEKTLTDAANYVEDVVAPAPPVRECPATSITGGGPRHHLSAQGRVWEESARDTGPCRRKRPAGGARCPRTGVSLHSCIHSSPLRKQSVEGRP